MDRADLVTGLVFVLLGALVLVESLRMPTLREFGMNPYTAPGIVPGLLGIVIAGLGAVLVVRAARRGGFRLGLTGAAARGVAASEAARRLVLTLVLTLGYAAGLIGRLPFWLATFLFVLAFVVLFEWRPGLGARASARTAIVALVLAAAVSAIVTYVFQNVFLVRLP